MKKGLVVFAFSVSIIGIHSCISPKNGIDAEIVEITNPQVDSLEQARLNRVDSTSQITSQPNTPSGSFTNPPKTVKKKVKKD
jgi:hypothetical protein